MTLTDFLRAVVKKWYLVLLIPLLLSGAMMMYIDSQPMRYRAGSALAVSSHLADVNDLAFGITQRNSTENIAVSRWSIAATKTTSIYAIGHSRSELIDAANRSLDDLKAQIKEAYPDVSITSESYAASVVKVPLQANKWLYTVSCFIAGLVLAFFLSIVLFRRSRHSEASIVERARHRRIGNHAKHVAIYDSVCSKPERVIRVILYCIVSACFVLTTNSLFYLPHPFEHAFEAIIILLIIAMVIRVWIKVELSEVFVIGLSFWFVLLALVFIAISFPNENFGSESTYCFFCLLGILPLFIGLIRKIHEYELFLKAFCTVVSVLAGASVVLWLLGSVFQVIQPNCSIVSQWTALPDSASSESNGFCFLVYQIQKESIGSITIFRNTGIFPESPMYAYVLVAAFCFELFLSKRSRIPILIVLVLTMFSTTSTTAIVLMIVSMVVSALSKAPKRLRVYIAIPLIVIALIASLYFVTAKLESISGNTHLDDFAACFKAWLNHVVYGNGFDNQVAAQGYMSDFRLSNPGLSNGLGYVLMSGGLVYLLVYAIPFFGYFQNDEWKNKFGGLILLVSWAVTLTSGVPLTALILAIGIVLLLDRMCVIRGKAKK